MGNISEFYAEIEKLKSEIDVSKYPTNILKTILAFLKKEILNPECRFRKYEYEFSHKIKTLIEKRSTGLKKIFPFLISTSEIDNLNLLKQIDTLYDTKREAITAMYSSDISVVDAYIKFAVSKLKKGEVFFYIPEYKDCPWTKKDFPMNMYRFLCYSLRINPYKLSKEYIDELMGYFALYTLGLEDKEITNKVNEYFVTSKDPFEFNISEKFREVRPEIFNSVVLMSRNELFLQKIAESAIKKYGDN